MSILSKTIRLNDGTFIPRLAFGTATVYYKKPCTGALLQALNRGFRHIDTAASYENEQSVGEALAQWTGSREEVYITTKYGNPAGGILNDPRASLRKSLELMGLDYVDLFLIHGPLWLPPNTLAQAWKIMEELQEEGLCRSIGLSNFSAHHIEALSSTWKVIPAVNQVEYSPYIAHDDVYRPLKVTCEKFNIVISGFSTMAPLAVSKDGPVDPVLQHVAGKRGSSDTQVLLQWAAQTLSGPVVLTTGHEERMSAYLDAMDMEPLTEEEIERIGEAGEGRSFRKYPDDLVYGPV